MWVDVEVEDGSNHAMYSLDCIFTIYYNGHRIVVNIKLEDRLPTGW